MDNLSVSLANYVKKSREFMQIGDLNSARDQLMRACECALLLAKSSSGRVRDGHIATFTTLKASLDSINEKISAASGSAYEAPAAPQRPAPAPKPTPEPAFSAPASPSHVGAEGGSANSSASASDFIKKPAASANVGQFTGSLSPKWLSDYIGQPQAVTAVKDLIDAALLRGAALPHIILYGSHGLGKTTFSKIIANEMGANFIEVNVMNINAAGMIAILKQIKPRDILFIDEIHTLPLQVAESVMYSAMQDGRITYTEGKGKFARTETLELPPFTLIGATTEIGKLAKPFTQRAIQVRLEEYTDEVLSRIISASFYKLGMKISSELSLKISKRCRNNPRIANNTVKRISDKALVKYAAINNIKDRGIFGNVEAIRKLDISVSEAVVNDFFEENGIDENGLEKADRELLRIIITRYGGGPVGIDTLARALNEANNVISQKYEAFLIKKGMLKIEREGRVVMAEGYRALGLPVPENLKAAEKDSGKTASDAPASKYEKRKIIASHVPDELKCQRIENLIVYPENAVAIETSLDELFPDVE